MENHVFSVAHSPALAYGMKGLLHLYYAVHLAHNLA